jgi:hypothetical protein
MLDFTSQTHAVYVGIRTRADKRKFYILSTHCAALQKREASKPMSRRVYLLNPNQIS